jgi:hypothetical protein
VLTTGGLIFGYLIAPRIISNMVDKSTIVFHSVLISAPTDTGFRLVGSATMHLSISLHMSATVEAMKVHVFYEGFEIGSVDFPQIDIDSSNNGDLSLQIDALFAIKDNEAFSNFAHGMINDNSIVWQLSGATCVLVLGFTFPVQLDKQVLIQGVCVCVCVCVCVFVIVCVCVCVFFFVCVFVIQNEHEEDNHSY